MALLIKPAVVSPPRLLPFRTYRQTCPLAGAIFIGSASNDPWHVMGSVTAGRKEGRKQRVWAFWLRGTLITKRRKNADDSPDLFQNAGVCGASCRGMILCNQLAVAACVILSWEHWWNHSCDCHFFLPPSSLQTQTLWQYRATHFRASLGKF